MRVLRSLVARFGSLEDVAGVPLFSPLPVTTLERLASRLSHRRVPAGTANVREGDAGDLFYVIASGTVDVECAGTHEATLGPGEYFGEVALLRDVPRIATCRAETDVEPYTLERDRFVSAVSGHETSAAKAESVTEQRLAEQRARAALTPF